MKNNSLMYLLCSTLLVSGSMHVNANELAAQIEQSEAQERIEAGTRCMSLKEHVVIQEQRAAEEKKGQAEEKQAQEGEEDKGAKAGFGAAAAMAKAALYFTSHNGVYYTPLAVSAFGNSVELSDGSIWSVCGDDCYKTLNWLTSDLIVVTPNQDWFSIYGFRLNNQNTGVSVRVNLTLGPIYNGIYTHWIVAIDSYQHIIYLEDGSVWKMCASDWSTYNKWMVNDTVIFGINDGWLSTTNPNILLNVNTLNYSRGICIH